MDIVRLIRNPDDTVMIFVPNPDMKLEGETDLEFIDRMAKKDLKGPKYENKEFVDIYKNNLPQDRADRAKWRWDPTSPNKIKIDMTVMTKADRRKELETNIQAELDSPAGNPLNAIKMLYDLTKGNF